MTTMARTDDPTSYLDAIRANIDNLDALRDEFRDAVASAFTTPEDGEG